MQEEIRFFFSPLIFSPNRRISAVYRQILSLKIPHIRHWLLSSAKSAQNIAPAKPYTHIYQTNTERKKADHNYNQDQVQFLTIYKQNLNSEFILLSPEYMPESTLKLQASKIPRYDNQNIKNLFPCQNRKYRFSRCICRLSIITWSLKFGSQYPISEKILICLHATPPGITIMCRIIISFPHLFNIDLCLFFWINRKNCRKKPRSFYLRNLKLRRRL